MNFQKNQILEAEICDINMLGFGVAKISGAVIFIKDAIPGEICRIRIIKCEKNYYVGKVEERIKESSLRNRDVCPHFLRCGGCAFQHIHYDMEKDIKKKYIESCLKKGGVEGVCVLEPLSTDNIDGYRNKAQFPVSSLSTGEVFAGFYSPRTHKICAVDNCRIQDPTFLPIVKHVCRKLTQYSILPYREDDDTGLVRHIYLRRGKASGEVMLCLVLKKDAFPNEKEFVDNIRNTFPEVVSIVFNIQPEKTNVILGKKTRVLWGKEKISDILCDRKLELSPLSFYQVNHDAAELLYRTAFEMANLKQYDHILDLYCGIGSISLSAAQNIPILGVEIISEAVDDARHNADINGVKNASFVCGDAIDAFSILKEKNSKFPLVIVDPPRKGLPAPLIHDLAEHRIPKILYISCAPDTLARDLRIFQNLGFAVGNIQPVDLFPRTGHVECAVMLTAKNNT